MSCSKKRLMSNSLENENRPKPYVMKFWNTSDEKENM